MKCFKNRYNNLSYIIFTILSLFSISLIFNNNVWFDEAYTLSLIQHNYSEVIEILKSDMHPPLYFISLKFFCEIFGYSILVTKIFSVLGYIATLLLGCTVVKKHFGSDTSMVYMLTIGAIPMSLYFSVQQSVNVVVRGKQSGDNKYNAMPRPVIFIFVNIYAFVKDGKLIKAIIISDIAMTVGYSPWIIPLLYQTEAAAGSFWLKGVEPLSVVVFASGLVISTLILAKKENRRLSVIFAITCVLSVQAIGLLVTIFIRPFYIARYSVVISGIFALLVAFGTQHIKEKVKNIICVLLCALNVACLIGTGIFEYNPSMNNFFNRFDEIASSTDTFLYCDSSFGILSYYYPENTHICTYSEPWFVAFDNIECINKNELSNKIPPNDTVWFVKNELTKTPEYIQSNFDLELVDSFKCDFNTFNVYLAKK